MRRLEGTPILVTGATGGLGGAIVARLAAEGATIVATDRNADALAALQKAPATPTRLTTIAADLLSESSIEELAAAAAAGGTVDGLVNCAGMYPVTPLDDLSAAEWDEVLGLNLRAPFLLTRALVPAMRGRDGAVVNISSTASVLARPGIAHYGASKAGLSQLTRVLAVEIAPHRIRVNAVLPGVIATERVLAAASGPAAEAEMRAKVARIPLRRLGEAREVAP